MDDQIKVKKRMKIILNDINIPNYNFEFANGENEVDELLLISLCDIIIIANSTFSWWGALFSGHNNIYCPEFSWFKNTHERLILPGWNLIK